MNGIRWNKSGNRWLKNDFYATAGGERWEDTLRICHLNVIEMRNRIVLDVFAVFASSSRLVIASHRCDQRPVGLNQRQRCAGTGLRVHQITPFYRFWGLVWRLESRKTASKLSSFAILFRFSKPHETQRWRMMYSPPLSSTPTGSISP